MFKWFKRKALEIKTSISTRTLVFGAAQANFNTRQYSTFAKEGYQQNVIAFDAINQIAKGIASIDFIVFKGEGEKKEPVQDDHPLVQLLAKPNPWQAGAEFFESVISFYLISGNTYIEKSYPFTGKEKEIPFEDGEPIWLYSLRPELMLIQTDDKGRITGYDFGVSEKVRYLVDDDFKSNIIHMKSFHPLNNFYGLSPMEAAAFSIDQHNEAGKWNQALLQNGSRPSGALIVKGDENSARMLSDDEHNRLKKEFEDRHSGGENAGKPLLLEGGLEWIEMGLSPKDMDFLEAKNSSARDIAKAFGVPPILLGLPGDSKFRNLEAAEESLWENTILPLADSLLDNLNQHLSPLYDKRTGGKVSIAFDIDSIQALAPRRARKAEALNEIDYLTDNEKREAVGKEPITGGDKLPERRQAPRDTRPAPREVTKARYCKKLVDDGMEMERAIILADIAYGNKSEKLADIDYADKSN